MMLRHMGFHSYADRIEKSALSVLREGKVLTGDLGGTATTTQFTEAICQKVSLPANTLEYKLF